MLIGVILGSVITATVTESMTSTIDFNIKEGHKVCFTCRKTVQSIITQEDVDVKEMYFSSTD